MILADLCLGTVAFFLGYFIRDRMDGKMGGLAPLESYIIFLPLLLIFWGCSLYFFRMYTSFRLKSIWEVLWTIVKAITVSFWLFGTITYLFKLVNISRAWIVLVFSIMGILLVIEKTIFILLFRSLRRKGFNFRNILIVGSGTRAQNFIRQIQHNREFGLQVLGIVDEDGPEIDSEVCGCKVIGKINDIPEILNENAIDHVFFIVPRSKLDSIEVAILHCETVGVAVSLAVDLFELQFTRAKESNILGLPVITFESASDKIWQLLFKRLADIVLSVIALCIIYPFYVLIALVIKMTSKGPVYFIQTRCGLQGRPFSLYKFRTMEEGAEAKLQELLALNEMRGPAFKLKDDPRVTKIGKILRKTSLDELPQLWNVLKGEMSLVGPRPPLPKEVEQYDHWHRRRLSMRPGITCLWQISGRNNISDFNEWMNLDLEYIDNWSLGLDFKILLKTIPVVLFGVGAR
ncbi:MAG: sugar transferase [Candidatus Omnitrophica bacterium]|nr:sugar transferase [Candidatus Omnitrophota bacterium]